MNTELPPKSSGFKLTSLHTLVATLAGIISIMGGLYSLKISFYQPQGQGILQGIVRDQAIAKPLRDAAVEFSDTSNFILSTLYTDDVGHYETGKLKEGLYIIKVTTVRHLPQTKNVTVLRNQTSTVNFDLVPEEDEIKKPSPALSEAPNVPAVQPAYVPPPPFSEPRYRPQQYRNRTMPSYEPAQRTVAQPMMAQSLVQAGLGLLGDYAAKKNKSRTTTETNQTNQQTNQNGSSDSSNSSNRNSI